MDIECIFCEIASGKLDSNIIYEDNDVLAFLDIDPINNGHILVVPRAHKLDIDEISEDELIKIMKIVNKMVILIKDTYNIDGYSIVQNGGEFNDIGHFHFHIVPRFNGDGFEWKSNDIIPEDFDVVLNELKKSLKN